MSGKTLSYSYDENGRLKALKEEDGKILTEYEYTPEGRLKTIRTTEGNAVSYGYDSDRNLSHLRLGSTEKDTILYDAFMV